MALIFKDYQKGAVYESKTQTEEGIKKANFLYALMPLVPIVILIVGASDLPKIEILNPILNWTTKIQVAEAMLLGAILAMVVTMSSPSKICQEFFNGMGSSYANVVGIIVAASVFAAGLEACGATKAVIEFLKNEQHYVRFGGTFIPFLMAMVTGSGDAPTMAFNQSITIRAKDLGFDQVALGMVATVAGVLGRVVSPIMAASIIVVGIAGINTIEIVKRTALGSIISLLEIAFIML